MLLLLAACATPPEPSPAAPDAPPVVPAHPDVVVISLDTTRADALSVYGRLPAGIQGQTTPHLDALAASGVRFSWALAQSPTTLASHSTVFTGLDAHATAIPRNGYPLSPDVDTVAERFAAAGYHTAAVLGSSALARPMGVDQGFAQWDEDFAFQYGSRHERRADAVADAALKVLAGRPADKPLFLFAHFYDAHQPYGAPEPYTHRYSEAAYAGRFPPEVGVLKPLAARIRAGRADAGELREVVATYLGEVAYVDEHVGRLLAALDLTRTRVVVFADHGDMFGEEPQRPFGHGADLDLPVTHVPLLVAGVGVPGGVVVDAPVGLQDVGATVLGLGNLPTTIGESRDLSPAWSGRKPPPGPRMLEATQPAQAYQGQGWNNLHTERGVLDGELLMLTTPWQKRDPTLHRLAPGMPAVTDPGRLAADVKALTAWDAAAPAFRAEEMSGETKEGLKALGYLE